MTYRRIYIKLGKNGGFSSPLKCFLYLYIIYFLAFTLIEQLNS